MKILLTIEYKGTNFSGWQVQPRKRTIQGEIQSALFLLFGEKITIFGSGRTDSGVHALGQTAHFEVNLPLFNKKFSKNDKNKFNQFVVALNSILPNDIKILKAKKVASHFHARYNVKEKIYLYKMQTNTNKPSSLLNELAGTCKYNLDIEKIREGAKYLIGEHDFTSFSNSNTKVENFIRTINYIKIKKESDIITFKISGNGFLYNMVRIIVGTLVQVGTYKINPQDIKSILEAKDRNKAGKTAEACGLYLKRVRY